MKNFTFKLTLNDAILLEKVDDSPIIKTTDTASSSQKFKVVSSNHEAISVGSKVLLVGQVREVTIENTKYTLAYPANVLGIFVSED